MLAYGVYKVAYDLKLNIPEDLSIVGFDNSIMSDVIAPHLTTYETPAKELAQLAVKAIDECISTGKMPKTSILEGKWYTESLYQRNKHSVVEVRRHGKVYIRTASGNNDKKTELLSGFQEAEAESMIRIVC